MVAGKDDAAHATDGNPAGGFECLGGLVDEECAELHAFEQSVAAPHECGGDDASLAKELLVDAYLECRGTVFQPFQLLVVVVVAPLVVLAQFADGLA